MQGGLVELCPVVCTKGQQLRACVVWLDGCYSMALRRAAGSMSSTVHPLVVAAVCCVQDIPRSADRAPSRCFYTFKADTDSTYARLIGGWFCAYVVVVVVVVVVCVIVAVP
jgi:hypothetical protein